MWVTCEDGVYDVESFVDTHPRAARVEAAGTVSTAQGTSRTSTEVTHAADGRRFRQSNAASKHKPGVREARKDF